MPLQLENQRICKGELDMPAGGFLEQKRRSPGSLAVVVALHGAAITALLLAKSEFITHKNPPIVVRPIPEPPEPPPPSPPERREEAKELPQSVVDYVPPKVPVRTLAPVVLGRQTNVDPVFDPGPVGTGAVKQVEPVPLPPPPLSDPVRTDAQLDARSQLQPAYPAAEQRAEREGSVTVRLLIGADGRVKAVGEGSGDKRRLLPGHRAAGAPPLALQACHCRWRAG
jgi:protein TonB